MFDNLIESASHNSELKRRSSFFLGALGGYSLLFMAIGVASVFAYDANLDKQNLELVSLITPVDNIRDTPQLIKEVRRPSSGGSAETHVAVRTANPPSNDPTKIENGVRSSSNQPPPLPPGETRYVIGSGEFAAIYGGPGGSNKDSGRPDTDNGIGSSKEIDPPPPVKRIEPKVEKPNTIKSLGVINGLARVLPIPRYPALANLAHVQGTVTVQILIDESGNVISAKAISGHPLLLAEAVKAAYLAKFSPTLLSKVPVKVSGIINYNFKRQ
jgi:protein TonB